MSRIGSFLTDVRIDECLLCGRRAAHTRLIAFLSSADQITERGGVVIGICEFHREEGLELSSRAKRVVESIVREFIDSEPKEDQECP